MYIEFSRGSTLIFRLKEEAAASSYAGVHLHTRWLFSRRDKRRRRNATYPPSETNSLVVTKALLVYLYTIITWLHVAMLAPSIQFCIRRVASIIAFEVIIILIIFHAEIDDSSFIINVFYDPMNRTWMFTSFLSIQNLHNDKIILLTSFSESDNC